MKKVKIAALLSAILTGLSLFFFLKSIQQPTLPVTRDVLVAAADIQPNQVITQDMIAVKKIPVEAVHPLSLQKSAEAVGLVTNTRIISGEQIISADLLAVGQTGNDSLAYSISPGMRAVTVEVNQISGLAYLIRPGNKIDLIAELSAPSKAQADPPENTQTELTSKLLVENCLVLAVDTRMTAPSGGTDGGSYSALTLQVTPAEALEISLVKATGSFNVALRSPLDEDITDLPDSTVKTVMAR